MDGLVSVLEYNMVKINLRKVKEMKRKTSARPVFVIMYIVVCIGTVLWCIAYS